MTDIEAKSGRSVNGNTKWFSVGLTIKSNSPEVTVLREAVGRIRDCDEYKEFVGDSDNDANLVRYLLAAVLKNLE